MSLRLIEVFLPEDYRAQIEALLADQTWVETWYEPRFENQVWVRLLVDSADAEAIVDQFADRFNGVEGFRLMLLGVEASLPPQAEDDDSSTLESLQDNVETDLNPRSARINREEIFDRVTSSADLSWVQLAMVSLSTTIAAIGILRDSQAVVIGAMVIAPLLQPNMALGVATVLGKRRFALRALQTGLVGILLALGLAIAVGYAVPVSLESSEITSRIRVGWADGILALASGVAGAISLTTEARSSIVGVMVSVALLPPLVVLGLLIGAGFWSEALGAALLTTTNLICLNLAAVTTFLIQALEPRQQQDVSRAEETTRAAYGIWFGLLLGLAATVMLARFYNLQLYRGFSLQ
ncbi:TIGR00341 family protein [filamentous cyanobacterium CCP5]|nr:TIGR00341 family protein [filamentous cyanobacterium CCP5]